MSNINLAHESVSYGYILCYIMEKCQIAVQVKTSLTLN